MSSLPLSARGTELGLKPRSTPEPTLTYHQTKPRDLKATQISPVTPPTSQTVSLASPLQHTHSTVPVIVHRGIWGGKYLHLKDKETESQRGEGTLPKSSAGCK